MPVAFIVHLIVHNKRWPRKFTARLTLGEMGSPYILCALFRRQPAAMKSHFERTFLLQQLNLKNLRLEN
jgi:hypothetical protein